MLYPSNGAIFDGPTLYTEATRPSCFGVVMNQKLIAACRRVDLTRGVATMDRRVKGRFG